MDNEQIIHSLKGISSILIVISERQSGDVPCLCWGMDLINKELLKCIDALERNMS